jgi:PAS domain S-box-containing protein
MQGAWFSEEDTSGFAGLFAACEPRAPVIAAELVRVVVPALEQSAFDAHELESAAQELGTSLQGARLGQFNDMERALVKVGVSLAEACVATSVYFRATTLVSNELRRLVLSHFVNDQPMAEAALAAADKALARASQAFAVALLDIKERLLNEERKRAEQALLRFSRLFEAKILGILVCDLVGNILEANDGFLEMVGYSREELLSGSVRWADMTPAEFKPLDDDAVQQLVQRGVTRPWEKEYICKDGTRLPILVGVAMLDDTRCVAFVLDITERKRLEELRSKSAELENQNRRIREASRLKSEFLANMSHELRTPLNSIIGFAELLHDGAVDKDSPQHREFLGDILASGRHLLQLINDVLDLAKVESGKIEFRAERVNVQELVAEVSAVLRSIAASKRIALKSSVEPGLSEVVVDPARLKQVLYNYSSNAIKFTPEGGRVMLRVRGDGASAIMVEVEDTGIGIAQADFGRLFVEFQQLDQAATKRHGGTGLGLALTKRVVEAQGGSVGVRSAPGEGSLFFASIPLGPVGGQAHGPHEQLSRHAGASAILVVEDDIGDRTSIVNTLRRAGYDVETAPSGNDALAACRERRFDAITLDLLLPDTTGLEVLHRIREEGKNRATPVVVVTVIAERGVIGGFAVEDFLQKPVNGRDLLVALQRAGVPPEKGGTILVVDDDPSALKLMEATLRKLGYSAQVVSNAESALMLTSARSPTAVILDLLMPGIDGFEFLLSFRRQPKNATVPVVVWTNKDLTTKDHERLRELAHGVLAKASEGSLLDQLRALLPAPLSDEEGETREPSNVG